MFRKLTLSLSKTNSTKLKLQNNLFQNYSLKFFSAKDRLISAFEKEIDYEEKEYQPIPSEEKDVFFKNSGFSFTDPKGTAKLELRKTHGDYQVSINFYARSPMPEDEESDQQQQQQPSNMTDFQVLIQKIGKSSGFLIEAVTMDGTVNVNQVHCNDNISDYHTKYVCGTLDADTYQGPDFTTLDENLQKNFTDFLIELGVNEECAAFIEVASLDKDQVLYMNWLKNARNNLI